MKACVLIRQQPHYRFESFKAGLEAAGYPLVDDPKLVGAGDVLVMWNRYASYDDIGKRAKARGARVLIAENGYIGKDADGIQHYSLARDYHHGFGSWYVGVEDRWAALGIETKPWRQRGTHVLVCAQRGIGPDGIASPPNWAQETAQRLSRMTKRPIRIREHPESRTLRQPVPALELDLEDCHALVTWTSTVGVKAIVAGVPVFYCAKHTIFESASKRLDNIEAPWIGPRKEMLHRLAWAQWSVAEIASGLPFRYLLS